MLSPPPFRPAGPAPELIADAHCVTGEEPHWHPDQRRLYWLDNVTGRMFRYDPATRTHERIYEGEVVGSFTFQADGALLLFMARGAVKIWREGELTTVREEIPEERDSRFNSTLADPLGRVLCGTMPTRRHPSRLYRLDPDSTLTRLLDDLSEANGMGFTPDRRQLYVTDTNRREILLFDYEAETGALRNRRVFVRTAEGEGVPDGLAVDAEGYVWSARWGGGCIVRYTPGGAEERRLRLPVPKVSSMAFGGDRFAELYVTTAGADRRDTDGPGAGALFRLRPGVRGVPELRSRVL